MAEKENEYKMLSNIFSCHLLSTNTITYRVTMMTMMAMIIMDNGGTHGYSWYSCSWAYAIARSLGVYVLLTSFPFALLLHVKLTMQIMQKHKIELSLSLSLSQVVSNFVI